VMSIGLMPGSRLPAVCTSMGRVLLATLPEAEAKKILATANLTPRTPRSLTDPKEILARLSSVRRNGFCVVDQEVELGLRSIAVPLFNADGKTVAALNIGLAAIHETPDQLEIAYLPALKAVQSGIQRILK
jgi:IclR family pca regulon transcriptional regulator